MRLGLVFRTGGPIRAACAVGTAGVYDSRIAPVIGTRDGSKCCAFRHWVVVVLLFGWRRRRWWRGLLGWWRLLRWWWCLRCRVRHHRSRDGQCRHKHECFQGFHSASYWAPLFRQQCVPARPYPTLVMMPPAIVRCTVGVFPQTRTKELLHRWCNTSRFGSERRCENGEPKRAGLRRSSPTG